MAAESTAGSPETGSESAEPHPRRAFARIPRGRRLLAVVAVAAAVAAGASGLWVTGHFLPSRASSGASPAGACESTPVALYGGLASPLEPQVNRSYAQLADSFGNRTAGCATVRWNATPASNEAGALDGGGTEFLVQGGPPTAAELTGEPEPLAYFPEFVGAVSIVVHPSAAPGPIRLSSADLAGMYLGTLQNWSAPAIVSVNPDPTGVPSGTIVPAYLAGATDATAEFSAYLARTNGTWNRTIDVGPVASGFRGTPEPDAEALLAFVASTPGAIGYVADVNLTGAGVGVAEVANAAGAYACPNSTGLSDAASSAGLAVLDAWRHAGNNATTGVALDAAGAAGNWSYPLTIFGYVVLFHDLSRADSGRMTQKAASWLLSFFVWVANGGQAAFDGAGFVELPGTLSALSLSVLEGVSFQGEPVLTSDLGGGEGSGETGNETGEL